MDLENQNRVKALTEEHGAENIMVIFGAAEAESAGLAAETVTAGDPTFAGSLAGVELGLSVYHAVEPEFKEAVDADVFEEQVGMMEMVLEVDEIVEEMSNIRNEFCKYL
jgi:betaine reductase